MSEPAVEGFGQSDRAPGRDLTPLPGSAAAKPRVRAIALVSLLVLAGSFTILVPDLVYATSQTRLHRVVYVAPVDAPVIDPFRPPAHIGAPGNRGLEYATQREALVVAAAPGEVHFAGSIAGKNYVSIVHQDGVRTTYSDLLEVWVSERQWVNAQDPIGLSGDRLHFGAVIRERYLDPAILLNASQDQAIVRLVSLRD